MPREKTDGTIELRVYTGADGFFSLYEDEVNDNFDYIKGISVGDSVLLEEKTKTLTIVLGKANIQVCSKSGR